MLCTSLGGRGPNKYFGKNFVGPKTKDGTHYLLQFKHAHSRQHQSNAWSWGLSTMARRQPAPLGSLQLRSGSCPAGATEPPSPGSSAMSRRRQPCPLGRLQPRSGSRTSTPRALDIVTRRHPTSLGSLQPRCSISCLASAFEPPSWGPSTMSRRIHPLPLGCLQPRSGSCPAGAAGPPSQGPSTTSRRRHPVPLRSLQPRSVSCPTGAAKLPSHTEEELLECKNYKKRDTYMMPREQQQIYSRT